MSKNSDSNLLKLGSATTFAHAQRVYVVLGVHTVNYFSNKKPCGNLVFSHEQYIDRKFRKQISNHLCEYFSCHHGDE